MNVEQSAQDLVPGRARSTTSVHVEQFAPPAPGTYWRLRAALEETDTTRLECPEMEAGVVLMLREIEYADGQPHAYRFAPHPRWDQKTAIVFHADDVLDHWDRCPEGESLRAADLLALQEEMRQTQQRMMEPPPSDPEPQLLSHDPSAQVGIEGQALVSIDTLHAMTARAEALKDDAKRRADWISEHSRELAGQGMVLANFHQERATAALAKAKAQLEGVEGILKTVENLRIYTGEGFHLQVLRDGAPAPVDAPITIYQDLLSLDEEAAILIEKGGIDHTQTDSLIQALSDPALLERLIPAERGIVLARFRSSYKEFVAGDDIATKLYNEKMTLESKRPRLLVRDGDRLALIDGEEILGPIKQLLPSSAEQSEHFTRKSRRWWDSDADEDLRITREDLDYAAAQRSQLGALDHYGKVLIMLWGLRDRGELFDESQIPRFANWFDEGFMARYLQLVSQDSLIGVERPSYAQWRDDHNAYLTKGSWVAVNLRKLWGDSVLVPGAYSRGRWYNGKEHKDLLWRPSMQDTECLRVQSDKDGLYLEVEARYCGYNGSIVSRVRNIRLSLLPNHDVERELLVLDRIRATELNYYLESRTERRAYSDYLELFRMARRWISARDAAELPWRNALREAVHAAKIAHDPDLLEDAITDAIAISRTSRRNGVLPAKGDGGHAAIMRSALESLHAALRGNADRVAAVEAWAAQNTRQLLRLVLSSKEGWLAYLVPTASEIDPRMGSVEHAQVGAVTFSVEGEASVSMLDRRLLRAVAHEQVIHDWNWDLPITDEQRDRATRFRREPVPHRDGAIAWLCRKSHFKNGYAAVLAAVDAVLPTCDAWFTAPPDLADMLENAKRHMRRPGKYVDRMLLTVPIGTARNKAGRPVALGMRCDALSFIHAAGDDNIKQAVREVINAIYARPQSALDTLEKSAPAWALASIPLDELPALLKQGVYAQVPLRSLHEEAFIRRKKDQHYASDQLWITSLHPRAAEAVPWLAKVKVGELPQG